MAVYHNSAVFLVVDSLEMHGFADRVELDMSAEEKDFTTYAQGGWRRKKVGLANHMLDAGAFADFDTTGTDPKFPISGVGGLNVFTTGPNNLGATVADPCFMGQGVLTSFTPLTGAVGDEARMSTGWRGDAQLVRGQVLHPAAARTATGNGTTTTFTAPTASQSLYANFHVLAVSGAGTITFTIQTDDNSGMTTPTTRITSSAFAAIGAQRSSLAGALAGETHIRVSWTIAGFTSVTFFVAAGVL